jgi:hypothetical protein
MGRNLSFSRKVKPMWLARVTERENGGKGMKSVVHSGTMKLKIILRIGGNCWRVFSREIM